MTKQDYITLFLGLGRKEMLRSMRFHNLSCHKMADDQIAELAWNLFGSKKYAAK